MEPDLHNQQQRQHSVVIITLPPSDDPSHGKTISVCTLTDHEYTPEISPEEERNPSFQPDSLHQNFQSELWFSDFSFGPSRLVLGLLGISLIAVAFYGSVFPNSVMMFRVSNERDNDDDNHRDTTSFIFPVYHKLRAREIPDRILAEEILGVEKGSFVESMDLELVNPVKVNNAISTSAGSFDSSTTIFPSGGNVYPDGLYFTRILVGKPEDGHYFHLDIDTGSDLTWIQCDAPCASCAKGANQLYKPRKNSLVRSSEPLCVEVQKNQMTKHCDNCQCDYEIDYADQSSSMGVLTKDDLHLRLHNGSRAKLDIVFGCGYDQRGMLLNTLLKTDGILGLGRSKLSLPSQLASQGIISNVVGHCLASDLNDEGYIFMGSDLVPSHGITWVPMLHRHHMEFYQIQVSKMSYGNAMLSLDGENGRLLFDTGSSYTYFPTQAYSQLVKSVEEVPGLELTRDETDKTLPICWRAKTNFPIGSLSDVKQFFRPIIMQMGRSKWWLTSTKLSIQPEDYLIISNKGNVCLGILDGSNVHDGSTIIFGDISMRGHLIVYDNVKRRIGWMRSDCVRPREFDHNVPLFQG